MEIGSSTLSVSTNPIGYSLGSTYLSSQDVLPSLNTVVSGVKYQLQQFFASPTAFETLNFVFGITDSERSQTPSTFDSLGQILIPQIQLLDDGVLSGAPTVYTQVGSSSVQAFSPPKSPSFGGFSASFPTQSPPELGN